MKRAFFLLPLLALSLGCGEGAPEGAIVEGIVPVTGTATYQGMPLEHYTVFFSNGKDRPATDLLGANGDFALSTNADGDGAPVGSHKVWFTYTPVMDVVPGQEQADAPVPPAKVKLPKKYTSMQATDVTVEVPAAGLTDYKIEIK